MKRGARGTERFNSLLRAALSIGALVICAALLVPAALAQDAEPTPTPVPFPRVRNTALRDAAERVHGLMLDINDRLLERAGGLLDRAGRVLDRIADVAERRARQGYDVAEVRRAIADARQAIDAARVAIRDQASQDYVLDDATDRSVGDRLRAVRQQLFDDLTLVRDKVKAALDAVREAARALRTARPTNP